MGNLPPVGAIVRVDALAGSDNKEREGTVTKADTNKAGEPYFVLDCPDAQRYHTIKLAKATFTILKLPA